MQTQDTQKKKIKALTLGHYSFDEHGKLRGRIQALGLGLLDSVFVDRVSAEGKPYFAIMADPDGYPFEIGSAWKKTSQEGLEYYSVQLEPVLSPPIKAALFPDRTVSNMFNLVWKRSDEAKPEAKLETGADAKPAKGTGQKAESSAPAASPSAKQPKKQGTAAMSATL